MTELESRVGNHTNPAWATWIKDTRRARGLSRRDLAKLIGCDPSYVTHWERKGWVPRRLWMGKIARGLGVSEEQAMLVAGYSNGEVAKYYRQGLESTWLRLTPALRAQVGRLASLDAESQDKVARALSIWA